MTSLTFYGGVDEIGGNKDPHSARHHFGLKVGHYLMKPSDSVDAIATKSQTMQNIFGEIVNRLRYRKPGDGAGYTETGTNDFQKYQGEHGRRNRDKHIN